MFTKFASLEVGAILEVKGSQSKITGAGLDKLASYEDYRTDDGYLYTRVRAISSRVNKNHDGWPSEELAKSYLTFIGKPIFVDHNNSDPSRARGVIVDAKLHIENDFEKAAALDPYYASAPENHKPPTWVELLLEVDAKQFPKLARAIVADDIDGVSMGANVERSKCSHCANWATSPEEYCDHVMQKGATFDKFDDFGRKTSSPSYEDCYDIGFFEISYVFDPADETALDLGDKLHAMAKTAGDQLPLSDAHDPTQLGYASWDEWAYAQGQNDAEMDTDEAEGYDTDNYGSGGIRSHEQGFDFTGHEQAYIDGYMSAGGDEAVAMQNVGTWNDPPRMSKTAAGYQKNWDDAVSDRRWDTTDPNQCPQCEGRGCDHCGGTGRTDEVQGHMPVDAPLKQYSFTLDKQGNVHYAGPMDMGGYGDGQQPAANPASTTPQLPGAQDMNCPQCGGAMENGVCPKCTTQAQQPSGPVADGSDPSAGMVTGRIAKDGTVHYALDPHTLEGIAGMAGQQAVRYLIQKMKSEGQSPQAINQKIQEFKQNVPQQGYYGPGGEWRQYAEPKPPEAGGYWPTEEMRQNMDEDEFAKYMEVQRGHLQPPQQRDPNDPAGNAARSLGWDVAAFKIAKDGTVHYAQPELPQSMHMTSPEGVNTLRQEKICEVCGSDMDDGKCDVCNFEVPPEGFDNPDLAKAQEIAEQAAGAAAGGGMGEAPPGAMAAPPGGAPGMGTPAPGGPPPGAGGGAPMASTRNIAGTLAVKNAGKIRSNETPIIPATKTVSDHPTTTTVTKEPTRLVQSNTKDNMTQLTKAEVVAQMVKRGTSGVKTAADAEKLLKETGLERLLAASPASDPAEHNQSVDQVGGEVDNAEGGVTHENLEKVQDIEGISTMTWSDGKGDSLGQQSPVTNEVFDGGGPIGQPVANTKVADGQGGILGDPTNAEKQIDVDKPIGAEGQVGDPTKTFKSDGFHVGDPVTNEDSNQVGGPIGTPLSSVQRSQIVAHVLGALKLAEEMVDLGLISEEQKFEQAAQLEQESPEQLAVRRDMLVQTKRAGLGKTVASGRKLPLAGNSSRTASVSHDIADDNLGDAGLFR